MDDFANYGTAIHLSQNDKFTEENFLDVVFELMRDKKKRSEMSQAGKKLVDGKGIERIFNFIPQNLIHA